MAYATLEDLEVRWKKFDPEDEAKVKTMLEDASAMVDALANGRAVDEGVACFVVCNAVRRAIAQDDAMSVKQQTMTAGSYSQSFTYTNPSGDLYFTSAEKRALGVRKQRAESVYLGEVRHA